MSTIHQAAETVVHIELVEGLQASRPREWWAHGVGRRRGFGR